MMLLHFLVDPSQYVIPKRTLKELEGSQRLLPPFEDERPKQGWTSHWATIYLPKGKSLVSHMVRRQYPLHPDTPTIIGRTTGGRVHRKSRVGKVIHQSSNVALGG